MKCSRCQHENEADAKFCEECAAPLARTCAGCGRTLSPTAKFCPGCALPASAAPSGPAQTRFGPPDSYTPRHLAEKILTSKSALEGERKQVTVLFADLKGSMELLADRDPEEARKLLDPVLEHMMEAVHRYEGTVNQVMGDGIMALFGAPLAHEDHAVRACYAALRMQESVKQYAEGVRKVEGIPLRIRVGLNSGGVVVRSIGSDLRMDYTAVGQTTHLAARMEQMADPGSILMTADSFSLAEGYIQVKSLGPLPVKGLSAPVEVYEVVGVEAVRSRLHVTAARGLTQFVGRDLEMEQLRLVQARARNGQGQVIAVIGEPGVGKSRLYWEFTHSHRTDGWLVLESRSVSYGKATSYLPVIDLLKSYFLIDARDEPRRIREKVTGKLLSLDETLRPDLPALLALLDLPVEDKAWQALDPAQRRQRTLAAVKRLLLRESQVQPLVVVFEDLHWIDLETQACLNGLVESLPTAPLLLLVNYRPEYQHGWGSKTYYHQLQIAPLPTESAGALLQGLLGGDPSLESLKSLLIPRTGGNPFFLEESVRTLVETGVLIGARGAYRLARELTGVQVPTTVQAMLAARIDRLASEDKRLLQAAAVIGKDVPFPLLQAIGDVPEHELRRSLTNLQVAEFLYEARLFPDLEYTFKHALTHEVAYGTLLHERRRTLHARVADAIERLYADRLTEQVERIAHHAVQGELWDKAMRAFRDAANKASARSAPRTAAGYFDQALHALDHLPRTTELAAVEIDLHMGLHGCLMPLGEASRLHDVVAKAADLAAAIGDRTRLGRVMAVTAQNWWYAGLPERAIEIGEEAVRVAEDAGDELGLMAAKFYVGLGCHLAGEFARAVDVLRQTAERAKIEFEGSRLHPLRWRSINLLLWLAWALGELGDFSAALGVGKEAVRLSELHGTRFGLWHALTGLGGVQLMRGDVDGALSTLLRALGVAEESDFTLMRNVSQVLLGYAYLHSGNLSEAGSRLERATADTESLGFRAFHTMSLVYCSEAHLRGGDLQKALAAAERAAQLTSEYQQHAYHAWALWMLGEVSAHPTHLNAGTAEARYLEAIQLATGLGMRPLVAHCHLGLGKLYRRTGKRQEAQQHLATATTMYREMDMRYWLEQAEVEMRELP